MKSFDEWFDNTYPSCLYRKDELRKMREDFLPVWQAAQEVQRESDAELVESYFLIEEPSLIASKIRNNKAV